MSAITSKIENPFAFVDKLRNVNDSLYELFELCREQDLAPYSDDGCMIYDEGSEKSCFQVASQFKRPGEFLDTLLDILRVTYDPSPLGTLFLNSNPSFIYEAVPRVPFTLGYLSVVGSQGESFSNIWQGEIALRMLENGYDFRKTSALFVIVAASDKLMSAELIDEVHTITNSGFTVSEVFGLFASELGFNSMKPKKDIYSGFVWDQGLDSRLRVSIWLFIEATQHLKSV